jgi:hypothetical protein
MMDRKMGKGILRMLEKRAGLFGKKIRAASQQ